MYSAIHISRVLPYVYPEIFPNTASGESEGAAADARCDQASPATAPPAQTREPAADSSQQARRLKSLYQRALRSQHSNHSLTYSR